MEHILDQSHYVSLSNTSMLPDEIDGDDRMGTSGTFKSKMTHLENFSVDQSMYIANTDVTDLDKLAAKKNLMKRYSVIGNDQTFKQYTKNHAYDTIKFPENVK